MTPREQIVEGLVRIWGSRERAAQVLRDLRRHPLKASIDSLAWRDLEIFCGMTASDPVRADDPNGRSLERIEGRREVFFRLRLMLSIDPDDLTAQRPSTEDDDL
jgi:hypothetical protein